MKKTAYFALFGALFGALPVSAEVDCVKLSTSVKAAVLAEQSKVLEIVSSEVSAAPSCACEVVKAAIEGTTASVETVAAIVEAAAVAAPEQIRVISQCAVAAAPDALASIQAVLAKLDPNLGESGTSAKGSAAEAAPATDEVAAMPNPLDFPGVGPVGPTPGGPGGAPMFPAIPLAIINAPGVTGVVTDVNP